MKRATVVVFAVVAGLVVPSPARASGISVPSTRLARIVLPITPDDLKPPECASIKVTRLVVGTGVVDGTSSGDLILGGPGPDTLSGQAGDDCILGGGGDDTLDGGSGTDVCLGGPGTNTFAAGCETRT